MKRRKYYVGSGSGWFVVECKNKEEAKREGIREFGRGSVNEVREATPEEVKDFIRQKGSAALLPTIG